MAAIDSFLQKRKIHENRHGIIMVITAYVLSCLMLVLGSDLFYNINSAAAGTNNETQEETKNTETDINTGQEEPAYAVYETDYLNVQLINPYSLAEPPETAVYEIPGENLHTDTNTIWLLGDTMDGDAFDSIMNQAEDMIPVDEAADTDSNVSNQKETKTDDDKSKTYSVKVASGNEVIAIRQEEVSMLERITEAEASGEDDIGKILIVNVILNRIVSDEFPDTVKGVIFQHEDGEYQFSPVESGRYWDVKISKDTKKAVLRALKGEDYSEGALYFIARKHTKTQAAKWFDKNLDWLFKHGGHEFYK